MLLSILTAQLQYHRHHSPLLLVYLQAVLITEEHVHNCTSIASRKTANYTTAQYENYQMQEASEIKTHRTTSTAKLVPAP